MKFVHIVQNNVPEMAMDNSKACAVRFERNLAKNWKPKIGRARSRTEKFDIPLIDGYSPFLIRTPKKELTCV